MIYFVRAYFQFERMNGIDFIKIIFIKNFENDCLYEDKGLLTKVEDDKIGNENVKKYNADDE